MPNAKPWSSLALAVALCLPMTAGASAQSDPAEQPTAAPIILPEPAGLAWYRSIDLTGAQIAAGEDAAEVAEWLRLAESAGAMLDDLEYTWQSAYDPAALPDLGSLATVRVAGADTDTLRAAVVDDIVNQVVALGAEPPEPQAATVGGKDVVVVELPDEMGREDAIVYTSADTAYVLLLAEELAAQTLEQLP